jgi:hypothetical protein
LKPQINADFRGVNISYKIFFHNKLENSLLKNTHKKREDETLCYGLLFTTNAQPAPFDKLRARPERSRMGQALSEAEWEEKKNRHNQTG